jgi:transposase InsO family protein
VLDATGGSQRDAGRDGLFERVPLRAADRDKKFCAEFRDTLAASGVECVALPACSPNLNCYAERWVRSVKEECLSKLILFGEAALRRALTQFEEHYEYAS